LSAPPWLKGNLVDIDPVLVRELTRAWGEMEWIRNATGQDLLAEACRRLHLQVPAGLFAGLTAMQVGNLGRQELLAALEPLFERGTVTASDLADQIQLCRAFADPGAVTDYIAATVKAAIGAFPRTADDLKVGGNAGDVLDPFILAANFEILSNRDMQKAIESSASHKVLMKIEDLLGNLHQNVIGMMRGNVRLPEPGGLDGKEDLHPVHNPFPGADVAQVPVPASPTAIRLFQVKSKTGSAKGGDGKRLGDQLRLLERTYGAETFYVAVVGNTLTGHRSRSAVEKASPNTAVLVGEASLDSLAQSRVGGELLLRTYQRAFRKAAGDAAYDFEDAVSAMVAVFQAEAAEAGEDFLTSWLHQAVGGPRSDQDSRSPEQLARRAAKAAAAAKRAAKGPVPSKRRAR
jgi:hypothetical protein